MERHQQQHTPYTRSYTHMRMMLLRTIMLKNCSFFEKEEKTRQTKKNEKLETCLFYS